MFKKAGDPISYDKLLALLDEVRQKLLGIAPKRGGFVEQINANIDVELLKQILENGRGFDIPSFQKLTAFVCHLITEFQAPVRNLKTRQWIQQYLGKVRTPPPRTQREQRTRYYCRTLSALRSLRPHTQREQRRRYYCVALSQRFAGSVYCYASQRFARFLCHLSTSLVLFRL